jgi:hypothetical protein
MEEIKRQVWRARRRMILQQFLGIVVWSLFASLMVALIGLAVPKIWVLNVDRQVWLWSWAGGATGAGLLLALVWTFAVRRGALEAAIEIDRRFGLKERVSSTLSLGQQDLETEAGRALLDDAVRRVGQIDVREHFRLSLNWRALLPLLPAMAAFGLVLLVPDAALRQSATSQADVATRQQIKRSAEELKKKILEQQKKAEEKGLKDAEVLFKKLQEGIDQLSSKDNLDRKNALIELNNLAKDLEKRRDQLGGSDKMRQQLNQLDNIERGPADRIAKAIKEGDFKKALDELKTLQERLQNDELSEEEKNKLAEQMQQMQKKLEQLVEAHEQAKQDLEEQIKQKMAAGDLAEASKLQQKLDQLNRQNEAMNRMQQMANKMGQCADCLKNGNAQDAAAQMDQMAADLQDWQQQMDELQTLDDAMDQIAQAKDAMNCQQCDGAGCEFCQGGMMGMFGQGDGIPGMGLGEGQGRGDRPEEATDTNYYESQVRGQPKPGEAIRTGDADGPNIAGLSQEAVKQQISSSLSKDPDPLIDQKLPREQREHNKQYFDLLREGVDE